MQTAIEQATNTSVATIIEISASSHDSFEHAVAAGVKRAEQEQGVVKSAWIKDHKVIVTSSEIQEYRVHLKIVFEAN